MWTNGDSTRALRTAQDRELGIGLELGAGVFSGFDPGSQDSGPFTGHQQYEVGLVLGTNGRVSMTLGIGTQRRVTPGPQAVTVVFAELGGAVLRTAGPGGRRFEAGPLFRFGQGNLEREASDPSGTGIGLYLAQHGTSPGAGAWS